MRKDESGSPGCEWLVIARQIPSMAALVDGATLMPRNSGSEMLSFAV